MCLCESVRGLGLFTAEGSGWSVSDHSLCTADEVLTCCCVVMCLSDCVEDKFPKCTKFSSFSTAENPHPRSHPTPAWKTSPLSPTVAYASGLLTAFSYPCFELTCIFFWRLAPDVILSMASVPGALQSSFVATESLHGLNSTCVEKKEFSWWRRFSFCHLRWLNYYLRAFFSSG